jgi:glycine/D-amino acid oxidase-like deaminating enzyme
VNVPLDGRGRSWWLDDALRGDRPRPALEGRERADVCIVGGGYTGLWTALRLKELEPSLDVAIVEAGVCGWGASGRNGGFAMTLWHHFGGLQTVCGTDEALRLAHASDDAVAAIGRFCAANQVEADFRSDGWLWTATNEAERGAWDSAVATLERLGERPFAPLTREECAFMSGSTRHLDGVFERAAATLHPGRLVRGLARVAAEKGVRIFERSPMTRVGRSSRLAVETARGEILADRVVLALNAWTAKLPGLRRAFVTVSSDLVITDPVPDELREIGWTDGLSISDSRLMVHYYRTTSDGRVALGKGGLTLAYGDRVGLRASRERAAVAASRLFELYPSLASARIAGYWAGPIDRTVDGLPFFTALDRPDLICGAGFSGNGVGPSVLGGKILASLVLGLDDEWSNCGLVRQAPNGLPPEPIRQLGGQLVKRAVARNECAAEHGRKPRRIDAALASLAPAGLVPLE